MTLDLSTLAQGALSTLVYTGVGVACFGFAVWIMSRVLPFSLRKEIEEDQNTALGIIIGAVILGIALIVAATVHG